MDGWMKQDAEFEGSFHNGERVYGRVLWHPSNELSPGYRLSIEKLYLCAGRDGYVPLFEPNAERPQFGCLENSQRLKYRLLLLVESHFLIGILFSCQKVFIDGWRLFYRIARTPTEVTRTFRDCPWMRNLPVKWTNCAQEWPICRAWTASFSVSIHYSNWSREFVGFSK